MAIRQFAPQFDEPKSNNATLFVSLYIVLLAFFILLNAISVIDEERHKEAMTSVQSTFRLPREMNAEIKDPATGAKMVVDAFFAELKEVIEMAVPLEKITVTERGNLLQLAIPVEALFERDDYIVKEKALPFLTRFARSLKYWMSGMTLEVEMLFGAPPYKGEQAEKGQLAVLRAGKLARELVARGVKDSAIAAGAVRGNPEELRLTFIVRRVDTRRVTKVFQQQKNPQPLPSATNVPAAAAPPAREAP